MTPSQIDPATFRLVARSASTNSATARSMHIVAVHDMFRVKHLRWHYFLKFFSFQRLPITFINDGTESQNDRLPPVWTQVRGEEISGTI